MPEIRHYLTASGADPFQDWLDGLADLIARDAVLRLLNRVSAGNPGSHHHLREGVWELCIDVGPGYRVYYAMDGRDVIVVLGGGSKGTQKKDIGKAVRRWKEYPRSGT